MTDTPVILTDEERTALTDAAEYYASEDAPYCQHIAATLRGLLERLG